MSSILGFKDSFASQRKLSSPIPFPCRLKSASAVRMLNQVRQPCSSQLLRHWAACTYRTNTSASVCAFRGGGFFSVFSHFLSQFRCKWVSWICMKRRSFRYSLLPPLPEWELSLSHSFLLLPGSMSLSSSNSESGMESWRCLMGDNHKESSQWGWTSIWCCMRERARTDNSHLHWQHVHRVYLHDQTCISMQKKCTRYVIVACKRRIHPEQSVHQHIGLRVVYFLHSLSVCKDVRSLVSLNSAGRENWQ